MLQSFHDSNVVQAAAKCHLRPPRQPPWLLIRLCSSLFNSQIADPEVLPMSPALHISHRLRPQYVCARSSLGRHRSICTKPGIPDACLTSTGWGWFPCRHQVIADPTSIDRRDRMQDPRGSLNFRKLFWMLGNKRQMPLSVNFWRRKEKRSGLLLTETCFFRWLQ